jgi:hypothetical protein
VKESFQDVSAALRDEKHCVSNLSCSKDKFSDSPKLQAKNTVVHMSSAKARSCSAEVFDESGLSETAGRYKG